MILHIAAARQEFLDNVISYFGFVRSSANVAYGLTKAISQYILRSVVCTGMLTINPEQRIIRIYVKDRIFKSNNVFYFSVLLFKILHSSYLEYYQAFCTLTTANIKYSCRYKQWIWIFHVNYDAFLCVYHDRIVRKLVLSQSHYKYSILLRW